MKLNILLLEDDPKLANEIRQAQKPYTPQRFIPGGFFPMRHTGQVGNDILFFMGISFPTRRTGQVRMTA